MKLVCKDHSRDSGPTKCASFTWVVFICRFNNMEHIPLGTCKMWSFYPGGIYIQVVFKAGLTIYGIGITGAASSAVHSV